MGHFQVLFSGELCNGAQEADVRAGLARTLRIDDRKVAQLFSGRTVVLRSSLSQDDAFALQNELRTLGAKTRIKDRTPVRRDDAYQLDNYQKYSDDKGRADDTMKDITAAHFECPRCGFLQLEAEHCSRCGVDIAQAMREKRKEDLLIEKQIRELREKKAKAGTPQRPAPAVGTKPEARPAAKPRTSSWLNRLRIGR